MGAESFEPIRSRGAAEMRRCPQFGVVGAIGVTVGNAFVGSEVSSGVHVVGLREDCLHGGQVGLEVLVGGSAFVVGEA